MVEPINKELHFIIGIGRSGTTILNKVLNSHPSIHSLPEANFLLFFLSDFKNITRFTKENIELIFEQITIFSLSHPLVGWELDIEKTKEKVIDIVSKTELSYSTLCKIIYSEIKVTGVDKSNATILLDKNPAFTLSVAHLEENFPEAKFILLVRDYRANVLSRKQNAYFKSPLVPYNAIRWKIFNVIANKFYMKHSNKVLLLRYEDLVSDYDFSMKKVFAFLNVKEEDMKETELREIDVSKIEIAEEYKKYYKKKYNDLSKPINSSRVNAWQTELSKQEILECDAICAGFATVFGYEKFTPVSYFKKFGVLLVNLPIIVISYLDIKKDQLLFYVSAKVKMDALIKRHTKLGLIKSDSSKEKV